MPDNTLAFVLHDPVNYIDPDGYARLMGTYKHVQKVQATGRQAHHILPRRTHADLIKVKSKLMCMLEMAMSVDKKTHQKRYTNKWDSMLPKKRPG